MGRKTPNLRLSLPRCGNCERHWRPAEGVVAAKAFCPKCSKSRREAAAAKFGLKQITQRDITGRFLLPRRLRTG